MQKESLKENKKNETKNKKYRIWIVLSFFIIALMIAYIAYRGSYLETLELGEQYISIFWKNFKYHVGTFISIFLITYLVIYVTNKRIKKGLKIFFEEEKKTIPKMPNKSIAFIISIIVSFIVSNLIMEKLMLFLNATAFEITDPILGYDIGYFIFGQPFIKDTIRYLFISSIGLTIYMALYYIIAFNVYFDGIERETLKNSCLMKQLCNNLIAIAVFLSGYIFIETHNVGVQKFLNLKEANNYAAYGAGITDVTIKLWGYRILSLVIIISIIIATIHLRKKDYRKVIIPLLAVPTYLMCLLMILIGFEIIIVNPNKFEKQQEYIKANIKSTKQAYNINIDEIDLGENEIITTNQISNNKDVIDNIVIANKEMVLNKLNTLQTDKGYYTYRSSQIANHSIEGKQKLMYLSPREINSQTSTYNNKLNQYTHGNGLIITSATSVDEKGNLIDLQKETKTNNNNIINITQPKIYFGLETNDAAIINNKEEKNNYYGKSGLKLNFIDKLILTVKERNFKILFSKNESKVLINRNIIERAKVLLPNIIYDENPYLVIGDKGNLIWVLDGYTISNNYPYSQKLTLQKDDYLNKTEINYIRNSVKILIDAYDGTIKYYITDRNDPIIMAYQKLHKELFVSKDMNIEEGISKQFIYPEFLYNIQAEIIKRYHNTRVDVLYRGDDIWNTAKYNKNKTTNKVGTEIQSYYTMVKTVDSKTAKLGLVLPYTPDNKQNLTSYLVGTYENGKEKLILYKYSSDSNILGPMQIDMQLEQDERISSEIESLNVTGTKIIKNMIIVPIDNSLLYVEPIYQQYINEEKSTPILKKVVVASGNKIAIGKNIKEALNNLLSQYAVDIEIESTDTIDELVKAIIKSNNNLKKSSENNNWEMAGKDMTKLQELIKKLEKLMVDKKKDEQKEKNINNKVTENIIVNE